MRDINIIIWKVSAETSILKQACSVHKSAFPSMAITSNNVGRNVSHSPRKYKFFADVTPIPCGDYKELLKATLKVQAWHYYSDDIKELMHTECMPLSAQVPIANNETQCHLSIKMIASVLFHLHSNGSPCS